MTPPILFAVYDETPRSPYWGRLARALKRSAQQHLPAWRIEVRRDGPRYFAPGLSLLHLGNTNKLEEWADTVEEAPDGQRLLLIDADTVILRPLDDVWSWPFDLAYTVRRPDWKFPINGGVVFLRVGPGVRRFFRSWVLENRRMTVDGAYHQRWKHEFGGINQAAFGALLRGGALRGLALLELPCQEWNCEDSAWRDFNASTRILHIKAHLRHAVLQRIGSPPHLEQLADVWRAFDAQ